MARDRKRPRNLLPRRLIQLYLGLALYALSMAMLIEARLGSMPWDVFHQGITRLTGVSVGTAAIATGAVVLLLWIPLRQRPGLGTVSNVVLLGLFADAFLALLPTPAALAPRIALLTGGVLLNGLASGLYIGARLGPGPRDGLMTGIAARGHSVRLVRTGIEIVVVATGWLLGGTLGVGTLLYALSIGPLVQLFLFYLTARPEPADSSVESAQVTGGGVP